MDINLSYKTIKDEVLVEQEISKSKFLSFFAPISSEEEAKEYLKGIKKMHPKATHHCSAYIVDDIERSNDDGEPASSAGLPMLQVLRGNGLNKVIAVVVRYYGGTKLGVGGLIRAYGSSVTMAIEQSTIMKPEWVYHYELNFPYDAINAVEMHCTEVGEVINRDYGERVSYILQLRDLKDLEDLHDLTKGTIVLNEVDKRIEFIEE